METALKRAAVTENLLLIDGVGFYNLHNNKSFVFRVYPAGKWGGGRGKKKISSLLYYSRYPSPLSYFTSEPQLERSSHSNIHSFKDRDFNFFVVGSTGGASSYIVEGVHWCSDACSASELHGPIQ